MGLNNFYNNRKYLLLNKNQKINSIIACTRPVFLKGIPYKIIEFIFCQLVRLKKISIFLGLSLLLSTSYTYAVNNNNINSPIKKEKSRLFKKKKKKISIRKFLKKKTKNKFFAAYFAIGLNVVGLLLLIFGYLNTSIPLFIIGLLFTIVGGVLWKLWVLRNFKKKT